MTFKHKVALLVKLSIIIPVTLAVIVCWFIYKVSQPETVFNQLEAPSGTPLQGTLTIRTAQAAQASDTHLLLETEELYGDSSADLMYDSIIQGNNVYILIGGVGRGDGYAMMMESPAEADLSLPLTINKYHVYIQYQDNIDVYDLRISDEAATLSPKGASHFSKTKD